MIVVASSFVFLPSIHHLLLSLLYVFFALALFAMAAAKVNVVDNAPEPVNVVDNAPGQVNVVDNAPGQVNVVDKNPGQVNVVDNAPGPVILKNPDSAFSRDTYEQPDISPAWVENNHPGQQDISPDCVTSNSPGKQFNDPNLRGGK